MEKIKCEICNCEFGLRSLWAHEKSQKHLKNIEGSYKPFSSSDYNKKYYQENKDQCLENSRKWEKENPEKVREYKNKQYHKNKEKISKERSKYFICECGRQVQNRSKYTHKKGSFHTLYLAGKVEKFILSAEVLKAIEENQF